MEGKPRFGQEQPDESDAKESGSKKKRRDRAALGLGRYIERAVTGKGDGERADSSWLSPLYERVARKKDARILLPPVEKVADEDLERGKTDESREEQGMSDDTQESQLPTVIDEYESVVTEDSAEGNVDVMDNDQEEGLQEELGEKSDPEDDTEEYPVIPAWPVIERPVARSAADRRTAAVRSDVHVDEIVAQEQSADTENTREVPVEPSRVEMDPSESAMPREEPESLEDILRRRTRQIAYEHSDEMPADRGEVEPRVSAPTIERTVEAHHYHNPNAGLHLLNYALARRRDSRNRKEINKDITQTNRRISAIEKDQNRQISELELLAKQQKQEANTPGSRVVFERPHGGDSIKVVDKATKPEVIFARHHEHQLDTKYEREQESPTADKHENAQLPALEIMSQFEAPDRYSEMQFDRKHEIKDVSGDATLSGGAMGRNELDVSPASGKDSRFLAPADASRAGLHRSISGETKELLTTSAWGVLAGIGVFIIIYLATR